jgi:hypothetical protein
LNSIIRHIDVYNNLLINNLHVFPSPTNSHYCLSNLFKLQSILYTLWVNSHWLPISCVLLNDPLLRLSSWGSFCTINADLPRWFLTSFSSVVFSHWNVLSLFVVWLAPCLLRIRLDLHIEETLSFHYLPQVLLS